MLRTRWAQTLRLDVGEVRSQVDLTHIDAISLHPLTSRGRLWLLDAAAVRPGLAPVPDRSLPTVTVGRLTLVEGDQSPVAAALPLHISGRVTTPAVLGIAAERTTFGEWTTTLVTVRLEPGQTTATALIPFEADELDDLPRQVQLVFAAPRVGVVTSGFTGLVRVRDDDPTPAVSVTASPARATYGQSLQFRLTLSEPVDYYVVNRVRAVPSPAGPSLRTSDVTAAWLRAQLGEAPDDVPLWRVWHWGFMDLPPGALVGTVTIPTRAHPVHRSTKWLTVEVNAQHLVRGATATARVALP
jgi:hypothetical protein